jgi:hypothetical protein
MIIYHFVIIKELWGIGPVRSLLVIFYYPSSISLGKLYELFQNSFYK